MYGSPSSSAAAAAAAEEEEEEEEASPAFRDRKEEPDLGRQQQMSSGLLRYSSAPSCLIGELCEGFFPARPSSPEAELMFTRLLDPDRRDEIGRNSQFTPCVPAAVAEDPSGGFSSSSRMFYRSQLPAVTESSLTMEIEPMKTCSAGGGRNLIRQSSSPAGLFSHLDVETGYGTRATVGMPVAGHRLGTGGVSGGGGGITEDSSVARCFVPAYSVSSWDDSSFLSENFSPCRSTGGLNRAREVGATAGVDIVEAQNGEITNQPVSGVTHHFNLPKTSSEMVALEKFFQFQDSVPCKIRAKRGCATHPRSIAERVRRTRISERMRKLQELVPNMDKQASTADMLDLAVDYIKDLQKQVEMLSESRSTCVCLINKQKHCNEQAS